MKTFFNQAAPIIIFPVLLLAAATSPFSCGCSSGKDGGVFRSDNFGTSWTQKVKISDKDSINGINVLSLAIDPVSPDTLYLGSAGEGLYRSTDSAETWKQIEDKNKVLSPKADIQDIEIDPGNPNIIYLAAFQDKFGRVFRSRDNAQTWEQVYLVSKEKIAVLSIEIDKVNNNIIFVGTAEGGIIKSADQGANWQQLHWFNDSVSDIKSDPKNDQIVYLATATKGIYRTADQGRNWQLLSQATSTSGLFNPYQSQFTGFNSQTDGKIKAFTINPQDSKILYFGSEKGLFVSYNSGQNWQRMNILIPEKSIPIFTVAQDQKNPNIIYYGAGSIVYRTNDNGQTWSVNQISSSRKVQLIKIDPADSNIIYAGMHN